MATAPAVKVFPDQETADKTVEMEQQDIPKAETALLEGCIFHERCSGKGAYSLGIVLDFVFLHLQI